MKWNDEKKVEMIEIDEKSEIDENKVRDEMNDKIAEENEKYVEKVCRGDENALNEKAATDLKKSPKNAQKSPKNGDFEKLGNLNGDLRLIKNPKTECENTPVAGKIEVPGLEEGKSRIIVKSLSRLDPPPPAVGTMENPCLEELNTRSEVKSPKKLENPHPPQPPAEQ